MGYVHFFLLDDLIDENNEVRFYLPFDGFKTRPAFTDVNQYKLYKEGVMNFIESRNRWIEDYVKQEKERE
jgi:hypothetical protein